MSLPVRVETESNNNVYVVNQSGNNIKSSIADANRGQVVWPINSTDQDYIFIDIPINVTLQSTSAHDTLTGTGAHTLLVNYQDHAGVERERIVGLLGNTPVDFGELITGSFRMKVLTSGSASTNLGDITLEDTFGNVISLILTGEGETQIAVYKIPSNAKSAVVYQHSVSYARTGNRNNAELRLKVRELDGTVSTKWDPCLLAMNPSDTKDYKDGGIKLLPGEYVFWEIVYQSANKTPVRGSFDLRVELKPV